MKTTTLVILILFLIPFKNTSQNISLQNFGSGFSSPVSLKNAGDSRLFVVERSGYIQILNEDGTTNTTPFLDIDNIVSNSGGERGLLGLAFHPNYATNGYFYINYINNAGNTVISRFTVNSTDPNNPGYNTANNNSELILLTITQPFSNHNGGDIAFGPDNYLYIASGDGGSAGDPGDRAQSLNNLLGKILRIDVDNTSNGNNYAIPNDNPYANDNNSNTLPEIWAHGLRNPWKFSFDRETNDLWIADVGQNEIEEINMVSFTDSGINYGWRCYEGNSEFDTSGNCPNDINTLTFPVAQYTHNNSGLSKCSITGGYRYRGIQQSSLTGVYFFADFCSNEIGMLTNNGNSWDINYSDAFSGNNWSAFGEDFNGELYVVGISSGIVFRVIEENLSVNENNITTFNIYPNPVSGNTVSLMFNENFKVNKIELYNILGKLMSSHIIDSQTQYNFSIENLSSGVYIVKALDNLGNGSQKKLIIN